MAEVLAEVTDWLSLHRALRARAESLQVTRLGIDEGAGLQSGYAGKLLRDPP